MIQSGKAKSVVNPTPSAPLSSNLSPAYRLDPISGNWTIFAPDRDDRPEEFVAHKEVFDQQLQCPFCPGNEQQTPPAVWIGRVTDDDSGTEIIQPSDETEPNEDWSVRVVPNRFPAVSECPPSVGGEPSKGCFAGGPIHGGHEVVIESREHVQSVTQLDLAEFCLVFLAVRDRLRFWRDQPNIAYLSAFKNVGSRAGASLRHSHAQVIATDLLPPPVGATVDRMNHHWATTGCCLQCDLVRAERKANERIIWQDDELIAFCPFASHLPMLVKITSVRHQARFEDLPESTLDSVARLVQRVVAWIEKLSPGAAYNLCLHTEPPSPDRGSDSFHWSLELFPRVTQLAGFEWSSQCMINPILPEIAAARYRKCARAEDPRMLL